MNGLFIEMDLRRALVTPRPTSLARASARSTWYIQVSNTGLVFQTSGNATVRAKRSVQRLSNRRLIRLLVSKRFVKKQQMQWTPRGAHLLLQTRSKVLNNDLEDVFRGWYPQFHARAA